MIIKEKIGNLSSFAVAGRAVDRVPIEWYECNKRILHKKTIGGIEVVLKFLKEGQSLQQDDVLYADEESVVVVEVVDCDVVVIKPSSMQEMAVVCYEIGNKHLPLFYEDDVLLVPFDAPAYRMLRASGFEPEVQKRKL